MENVEEKMKQINGERARLAPKLPLKEPFSISVTTANVCNLECEFCAISEKGRARNKSLMDIETFKIFIDSVNKAEWHLKQIVLVGLGEPLVNPNIVEFVKMIKKANIAEKVHIVTNAVNLNKNMAEELIEAGLDVLRVSLNGLSDEDYVRYTNKKVDFNKLVEQIRYFHDKALNTKIYIKIMDYMVDSDDKLLFFKNLFEPISTVCNVEYLTEMSTTLDYNQVSKETKKKGLKGFELAETEICPLPFYHIYLNAEGTISACCVAGPWSTPPALVMGDLHEESINDIWNGKRFNEFFISMLKYGKNCANETCKGCKAYLSYIYPEDIIEEDEARRICTILEGKR